MKQETKDKYTEMFKGNDLFHLKDIMDINHNPHPFTIGPKHIKAANKNGHGGMLGTEVIKEVGCAHPKCNMPYEQHTSDTVIALQLKRNGTNEEANAFLKTITEHMPADMIDGFIMVETEEKFRIDGE